MNTATYDRLLETVHASAAFEMLRAGLTIGLFELIESQPVTVLEASAQLRISDTRMSILADGLKGLGLLERDAVGNLINCSPISEVIRCGELPVLVALINFQAEIVAPGQRRFTESLLADRNEGLHNFPGEGDTLYVRLEANPRLRQIFFNYMQTYTNYVSNALIDAHDFSAYRNILDVGGGGGALAARLVKSNPQTKITLLDTDFARSSFDEQMAGIENAEQIKFYRADMHSAPFPTGQDLVIFAHQLVIWSPPQNIALLRKSVEALIPGGTLLICSSMIDDSRDGPLMGLLDSVYFQSVAAGFGQIYSFGDYREWLSEVGLSEIDEFRLRTWTPHGIITAKKL